MVNTELLRKAIDDRGVMLQALMKALDIKAYSTIRMKINGETEFTASEIMKLCDFLHIPEDEREKIFFAKETEFNSAAG